MGKYVIYYKEKEFVLDTETKQEALKLKAALYAQDKKDGCYETSCYSIHTNL